jgi:hypothetical protein
VGGTERDGHAAEHVRAPRLAASNAEAAISDLDVQHPGGNALVEAAVRRVGMCSALAWARLREPALHGVPHHEVGTHDRAGEWREKTHQAGLSVGLYRWRPL